MVTEGPSEGAQPELTTMQYVILAENERKKRALAETKAKYSQLLEENKRLLQDRENTERENYEVTEYLRKELLAKTERLVGVDNQIQEIRDGYEMEIASVRQSADENAQTLLEEASSCEQKLEGKIADLEGQLHAVVDFQNRRKEIEEETILLREEKKQLEEELNKQKFELERNFVDQTSRLKKDFKEKLQEQKRNSEENIGDRLDDMVKRILEQNKQMSHELKLHIEQSDELQQEVEMLEEARDRLQREVDLKCELEKGFASRGARQSQQVKDAQTKIGSLESSLQELLKDMARQKDEIEKRAHAEVEDAKAEVEGLRRLVKLKSRELKNIRRLAQEVLLQRSDVECFLLSSLQTVRKEIERESFIEAENRKSPDWPDKESKPGSVDIKDLSWPDREKILRLLFAKITNQAAQMNFTSLPPHAIEIKNRMQGDTSTAGPIAPT
ncbi:hypothetical protein BSKO_07528 [Bryopsis sp. KO-2023]|nr:hypothetical protein BSKO_07528 [Bryopsis sp. KO-2023]